MSTRAWFTVKASFPGLSVDQGTPVTVIAANKIEAIEKAKELMGHTTVGLDDEICSPYDFTVVGIQEVEQ